MEARELVMVMTLLQLNCVCPWLTSPLVTASSGRYLFKLDFMILTALVLQYQSVIWRLNVCTGRPAPCFWDLGTLFSNSWFRQNQKAEEACLFSSVSSKRETCAMKKWQWVCPGRIHKVPLAFLELTAGSGAGRGTRASGKPAWFPSRMKRNSGKARLAAGKVRVFHISRRWSWQDSQSQKWPPSQD